MPIELRTPGTRDLHAIVQIMGEWQVEGRPMQLHPGDIGWFARFGAAATAAALRVWTRDGRVLAIGLLDGPGLLRVAMAEGAVGDEELALAMTADITRPDRGVLPTGSANVEAPARALLQQTLAGEGWGQDEPWAQLHLELPVFAEESSLRVEAVPSGRIGDWVEVERSAFATSRFTEDHWHAMVAGPASASARYLVGDDHHDSAVAMIAVWSAGPGRPGIIEPMGVHEDHRGLGYGRSITLAGAQTLQDLGSSSVMVATPMSFVGAVSTYRAAGFETRAELRDRRRPR